jgi:aminoglycoside phosphotransferase (APT) family kinase protein
MGARAAGLLAKEVARCGVGLAFRSSTTVPVRTRDLTPSWLEQTLGVPPGTVRGLRIFDVHHGTASRARIEVDAPDDATVPRRLFVKFTPRALQQQLLMNVMDLGRREVLFYDAVATGVPVRVPRCYAAQLTPDGRRNVLVFEDLSGRARFRDLREPCTADEAATVVDGLADLHAAYWQSPRFDADLQLLAARTPEADYLAAVIVRRMVEKPKDEVLAMLPPETHRASRLLYEHREAVDTFWAREPRTLAHGDPHLGNLYFEGERPGYLDWQAVTAGPGVRDLAYFLTVSVDIPALRAAERDLVRRYGERLAAGGVPVDHNALWTRYRAAITEIYVAAVVTAGTAERMQPRAVTRVGVERVVEAVNEHDSFAVLVALATGTTA